MSEVEYTLSELSQQSAQKRLRIERLLDSFAARTNGQHAQYVICSPGRVNLIGDHIDYHGFSVLPMAIESSIMLLVALKEAAGEPTIELLNTKPAEHPDAKLALSFAHGPNLHLAHNWTNYLLCANHGIMAKRLLQVPPEAVVEHAKSLQADQQLLASSEAKLSACSKSLTVLVDSDLPVASGLSSSSALVCGAALASSLLFHHAFQPTRNLVISHQELADDCSKFERLVGVHGGGMDQAVIMTAQEGYAKYVQFMPSLNCTNVRLPDAVVWLVSHSGIKYPKAATFGYNTRVLETKLGAAMIAKAHASAQIKLDKTITLGRVKELLYANLSTEQMILNMRHLFDNQNVFTVDEVCKRLELTRAQLIDRFNFSDDFLKHQLKDKFNILDRCEHVFQEARRVEMFKSICDGSKDVVALGRLMTESHESLKSKYACSHPSLDKLVSIALDAGALGARLTGAGWGGCTVTLVEPAKCETVLKRLQEESLFTFKTEPKSGCYVMKAY